MSKMSDHVLDDARSRIAILARENEQLRKALDTIIGAALGCSERDFPAAKVHRIASDALRVPAVGE